MELSRLAARQKRLVHWENFAQAESQTVQLKQFFQSALTQYRNLLAECWKAGEISPQIENQILALETKLERLDEEARLTVIGKV